MKWRLGPMLIGLFAQAVTAQADGLSSSSAPNVVASTPSEWSFRFTTYAWLPWLVGDSGVKGRQFDVDVGPRQILNHLDWSGLPTWMSYAEARRGNLTLFNDIVYSSVTGSSKFARVRNGHLLAAGVSGNVDVDFKQATVELGAGLQVWSGSGGGALDVLIGGRYWQQSVDVSVAVSSSLTLAGPFGLVDLTRTRDKFVARSGTVEWIDPFIGLRLRQPVGPGQEIVLRGDVGGFGVGSDISWQGLATYSLQLVNRPGYAVDAHLGYRALYVDYEQGSGNSKYVYDVLQHGPVTGLTVRF